MTQFATSAITYSMLVLASSIAVAQHRMFPEVQGGDPLVTPIEGSIIETEAGAVLTIDVYVEDVDFPLRLNGCQATFPCEVTCSQGGVATYIDNSNLLSDCSRPDFCFNGRFCDSGTEIGTLCTANNATECPGGDAGPCPPGSSDACWIFSEDCHFIDAIRVFATHSPTQAAIVLEDDPPFPPGGTFNGGLCNFGTVQYQLSFDARGDCIVNLPNEPYSASRDQNNMPIPFTTSPITLRVPVGACCNPVIGCQANTTLAECQSLAPTSCNTWLRDEDCTTAPCGCTSDECCADASVCSCDTCIEGSCDHASRSYGDANCSGGDATMDDILCALDGFQRREACPQADFAPTCTGNGLINLDDILQVIVGFSGGDPCACD